MENEKYLVDGRVQVEKFEDELIIIVPDGGIHYLNQTAGIIWNLIAGGRSSEEIAEELSHKYNISKEEALVDTQELIHELLSKELIMTCNS